VQQPDMRVCALNHLAVQLRDEAQDSVGCWMLRPKIERVILDLGHDQCAPP